MSSERSGHWVAHGGEEGIGSAGSVGNDPAEEPSPEVVEFVRYCYQRRRVPWPALYDDMCAVAARGEFRGLTYEQLEAIGIGFALGSLPGLSRIARRVIAEERTTGQEASLEAASMGA